MSQESSRVTRGRTATSPKEIPGFEFHEGDFVACLARVGWDSAVGQPLVLRGKTGRRSLIVPVVGVGRTREEVKRRLVESVDALFDLLEAEIR